MAWTKLELRFGGVVCGYESPIALQLRISRLSESRRSTKLFGLLHPEENAGLRLRSGFLLEPEQSTSVIVVHHPAAKLFVARQPRQPAPCGPASFQHDSKIRLWRLPDEFAHADYLP